MILRVFDAARRYEDGFLPAAGGWLDQADCAMEAIECALEMKHKWKERTSGNE